MALMDIESMKADLKSSKPATEAGGSTAQSQPAVTAVALLDEGGRIVGITADAAALLGYGPESLLGCALTELAAPGWKTVAKGVCARILFGTTEPVEVLLCGRSGRRTLVQMRARELDVPGGASSRHVVAWSQQAPRANDAGAPCRNDQELRRLAYGLLTNHEVERSRVAAELHDGVVPLVFMAKLMIEDGLQRLKHGSQVQATEALLNALGQLRDVSHEVRRISTALRPSLLDDLGLIPTVEWYCRKFCEACTSMRLEHHLAADEARINGPLKLEIFRILQEALNNVAQHAAARNVVVELVQDGSDLRLTVADDGIGFDAAQLVFGNACLLGVGLQSIRKRICATGGRLVLESAPGSGTTIGAVWQLESH